MMLAIRAGLLIDGLEGPPLRNAVVLVEGERITQVGPDSEIRVPGDAAVVDASDKSILPGLVDAHVHVHTPGGPVSNYGLAGARELQGTLTLKAYKHVRQDLEMGFTTLRSLASPAYVDVALRDAINQGVVEGPRLLVAGQGLSITGGHMDKADFAPEVNVFESSRMGRACDSPWEFRKATRAQFKRGVDLIKINACAEALYHLDPPYGQEMTYEEMAAVVEVAHWLHRRVTAHTSGGQGITDAIRAGVDSLEHAHWLSDEQIDMMVKRGTYYIPTLYVNSLSVSLSAKEIGVSDAEWAWLLKVDEDKWDTLQRAKAAGVKIAAGTDAGFVVRHGENACEMAELVRGGFTPGEAIAASTRVGAECLGIEHEAGTIEAGKHADLVVVDGDPLADISILQDAGKITQVYKSGKPIKQPSRQAV